MSLSNPYFSWLRYGKLYLAYLLTQNIKFDILRPQTVAAISSLLSALVLYPEVQIRRQEELDRVISPDRLPTFDDRPTLPYVEGIVKETLR
jgi:hypothetical protein